MEFGKSEWNLSVGLTGRISSNLRGSLHYVIAVIIAFASLKSQAKIARKRAAIDFFIRTELDPALREAYHDYVVGIELSKNCSSID